MVLPYSVSQPLNEMQRRGYSCNRIQFKAEEGDLKDLIFFYLTRTSGILNKKLTHDPDLLKRTPIEELSDLIKKELNEALKEEAERRKIEVKDENVIYMEDFLDDMSSAIHGEPAVSSIRAKELLELQRACSGKLFEQLKSSDYVHLHRYRDDIQTIIVEEGKDIYSWIELYESEMYPDEKMRLLANIKKKIAKAGELIDDNLGYA